MSLKELKWKLEDKVEDFLADPKKRVILAALLGFVIGVAVGYL